MTLLCYSIMSLFLSLEKFITRFTDFIASEDWHGFFSVERGFRLLFLGGMFHKI